MDRKTIPTRSAALQRSVQILREEERSHAYAEAFEEWDHSDDAELWEQVSSDGLRGPF